MENVQIPQELFMKLLRYHLLDDDSCTEEVKNGLEQKMNAMVERELYTRSKTAPTEEEREKARQEYLDRRGIPEDFRCVNCNRKAEKSCDSTYCTKMWRFCCE